MSNHSIVVPWTLKNIRGGASGRRHSVVLRYSESLICTFTIYSFIECKRLLLRESLLEPC